MDEKEEKMVKILDVKQTKDGHLSLVVDASEDEVLNPKHEEGKVSNDKDAWQGKLKKDMERRAIESVER